MVFPAEPMFGNENSIVAPVKQRSTLLVGFNVTDIMATAPLLGYTPRNGSGPWAKRRILKYQ